LTLLEEKAADSAAGSVAAAMAAVDLAAGSAGTV
jgi:hypothetical protein